MNLNISEPGGLYQIFVAENNASVHMRLLPNDAVETDGHRARAYSPDIGRFLQQDPAGMVDGPNLYAYVGNNPINRRDPSGMMAPAWFGYGGWTGSGGTPGTRGSEADVYDPGLPISDFPGYVAAQKAVEKCLERCSEGAWKIWGDEIVIYSNTDWQCFRDCMGIVEGRTGGIPPKSYRMGGHGWLHW